MPEGGPQTASESHWQKALNNASLPALLGFGVPVGSASDRHGVRLTVSGSSVAAGELRSGWLTVTENSVT